MSFNESVREKLPPHSIVLDNESYDNSIIGVSLDDRVIYSYEMMVGEYMRDNNCTEDEAMDWIDYNTIRAIPYFPNPRPMIVSEVIGFDLF